MTACRQCNKVLYDYYGLIPILFSVVVFFYSLLNLESSEMFRCGTARRPARGRMCGNTAQFAELISPSEGIRQTTTFSDLGIIIYIALQTGIPRNAVSLLRSCESLWTGVETVAFGETPLRPVPDVVRYHLMLG